MQEATEREGDADKGRDTAEAQTQQKTWNTHKIQEAAEMGVDVDNRWVPTGAENQQQSPIRPETHTMQKAAERDVYIDNQGGAVRAAQDQQTSNTYNTHQHTGAAYLKQQTSNPHKIYQYTGAAHLQNPLAPHFNLPQFVPVSLPTIELGRTPSFNSKQPASIDLGKVLSDDEEERKEEEEEEEEEEEKEEEDNYSPHNDASVVGPQPSGLEEEEKERDVQDNQGDDQDNDEEGGEIEEHGGGERETGRMGDRDTRQQQQQQHNEDTDQQVVTPNIGVHMHTKETYIGS